MEPGFYDHQSAWDGIYEKWDTQMDELRELYEKQDILDAWLEDAGIGFLFDLAREKVAG